jgi:hypothetical protein
MLRLASRARANGFNVEDAEGRGGGYEETTHRVRG